MKASLQNLLDIIIDPTAAFRRLKDEPKWVAALTVYCILSFLLGWALLPYTQKLLAVRNIDTPSYNKTLAFLSITAFSTTYTILMALLLSVILALIAKIVWIQSDIRFKHICAAFFHIMLIRIMTFLVNAALLPVFRDVEDVRTTVDARVIPGLHLLVGSLDNQPLLMFLAYINPIAVWYVFVLTIGVHSFAGVSKVKAVFVALIIWLFRVSLDTTFVTVFLP